MQQITSFQNKRLLCYAMLSHFSRVRLCVTPQMAATRLPHPWDSPGKNTGVGCHFPLQCMKMKSESEIAQSCPTLSDPMDCSPPGSSVHGFSRQKYWSGVPLPSPKQILEIEFNISSQLLTNVYAYVSCTLFIIRLLIWSLSLLNHITVMRSRC